MRIALWLLLTQCALGAYDELWHHELCARLPQRRAARRETFLHAARELLYAALFIGLAWREFRGAWAWLLAVVLLLEVLLTLADFLEEDRTRRLPPAERVLHTVLALNYGVWLAVFAPTLYAWSQRPGALVPVTYGPLSLLLTLAGAGVLTLALRNLAAGVGHLRPPLWVREPLYVGERQGPRTFLVTGATGFIGTALVRRLLARGESVVVLTRDAGKALEHFGPHVRSVQDLAAIGAGERIDGIINLAGAPILGLPWFAARRHVLLRSRLQVTEALVGLCRRLQRPPAVLVSGSAVGFYGVVAEGECDEDSAPQARFQSELCQDWEAAAAPAQGLGVRVVWLRTGLVLGARGGALPLMARPLRMFAGAVLGTGRQWLSWIHLDDLVRLIMFAVDHPGVSGALNGTAPTPVRHGEFQQALAARLRRPLWARVPARLAQLLAGEMAELLTHGQRVLPRKALARGFLFRHPNLSGALAALYPEHRLRVAGSVSEVYFNGGCSVCNASMSHYAGIARDAALPLRFVDATHAAGDFTAYGLRPEHLERRLYHRDAQGGVTSGLDALLKVWDTLPGHRRRARTLALPLVHGCASALYDLIVAPGLASNARRAAARAQRARLRARDNTRRELV
jgi:uncharacterized protein (TIGR01777 family)